MTAKTDIIRQLNDELRTGKSTDNHHVVITNGIQALGQEALIKLTQAVAQFDEFSEENDPYSEHDFGALEFEGDSIFWKIDYYDKSMEHGSEDATDPKCTTRVLTIMLAEEY